MDSWHELESERVGLGDGEEEETEGGGGGTTMVQMVD